MPKRSANDIPDTPKTPTKKRKTSLAGTRNGVIEFLKKHGIQPERRNYTEILNSVTNKIKNIVDQNSQVMNLEGKDGIYNIDIQRKLKRAINPIITFLARKTTSTIIDKYSATNDLVLLIENCRITPCTQRAFQDNIEEARIALADINIEGRDPQLEACNSDTTASATSSGSDTTESDTESDISWLI